MITQHTQTPWAQIGGLIVAHDGMVTVCEVATRRGAETPGSERLANGAFIVHACNMHDGLVAALRDICGMTGGSVGERAAKALLMLEKECA